ncbi:hypothetical protein [Burkholderia ambifaria]|jgi:hypothetical protein|uniref:hypothetical protein n=1 Tax=Burkholderia ambifaria TaxID=152480 RepID=UPI000FD68A60|nr:hypothetical protein [Burkholderia ambifaria]MBR7928754.1 hypothetical protein [Burkholderia ambifaria]QQC05519.1 hypothetical protein I6H84_06350 [Burkholderia ambifaria]UZU03700.1 hypothetical protein OR987_25870 [Burkholderia ambifaria]UZU10252.1 hypothetical protein OR988_25865 [Burkholderia ambifaria]WDS14134.1 hypothetical protein OR984_25830 [Burkholderia ambifaria]
MVTYPVSVRRDGYRGKDARKKRKAADFNEIAAAVENYVNGLLYEQQEPVRSYGYNEIASALGYDVKAVRDVGFSIDGGHNGFTAYKRGMTATQALDAIRPEGL